MDQPRCKLAATLPQNVSAWPTAEVFFLTALRCWLAGYETGDVNCWELAWRGASRILPLADAKRTIAEVGHFTRVLRGTLAYDLTFMPYCCGRHTEAEAFAVLMVGAAQRGDLVAAGLLARTLTQNDDHAELVDAASDLGRALMRAGLAMTIDAGPASDEVRGRLH